MEINGVTIPEIIQGCLVKKGQFVRIAYNRPVKVKKNAPSYIKSVETTVRIGINYDNQAIVQEKREDGRLPEENAGLIGRTWVVPNVLLQSVKSGKLLLRCTPVRDNNMARPVVRYIREADGVEVAKEEVEAVAYASEFSDRETPDAFDITAEYITKVI